jgi:glycosyltransferase involved in cell wall biosynthesis
MRTRADGPDDAAGQGFPAEIPMPPGNNQESMREGRERGKPILEGACSIVVITQNEESNIGRCLAACVRLADDVWVVDAFSGDRTVEIARALGAGVVSHAFESWGAQRNYALDTLPLKYEFALLLDADEEIDETFAHALAGQIRRQDCAAFHVNFDIVFLGKVLRYAHANPPVLRVVKRGCGRWVSEGAREYCIVDGPVGRIRARIRHEDRKGIFFWLVKQIRNAEREAEVLVEKERRLDVDELSRGRHFERPSRVRLRRLYAKLPPVLRPALVFAHRYFIRFGFLDGYPGLVFCLLHGLWYNLIIDVRVYERKLGHDCYLPPYGGTRQLKSVSDGQVRSAAPEKDQAGTAREVAPARTRVPVG